MPNSMLNNDVEKQIIELFDAQIINPVEIIYFTTKDACVSCQETEKLLTELVSFSDKIFLKIYDIGENPQLTDKYKIELAPSVVIAGRDQDDVVDYGIRFAGFPSGYEFSSFIQAILLVSKRDSGLKPETRKSLQNLKSPINLKVFATPT